jgi:hypothetical protein
MCTIGRLDIIPSLPRHGFAFIEHVRDGQNRVPQEHPGAGVPHDFLNPLTHLRLVTMDWAFRANGFRRAKHAPFELPLGVVEQSATRSAQAIMATVAIVAEQRHHRGQSAMFARRALIACHERFSRFAWETPRPAACRSQMPNKVSPIPRRDTLMHVNFRLNSAQVLGGKPLRKLSPPTDGQKSRGF